MRVNLAPRTAQGASSIFTRICTVENRPLDKGYTVHVTKKDGTVEVNHYILAEGTVLLAPDVLDYFPDSEAVNDALRSLIQLMAKVPARKYGTQGTGARQVAERK